MQQNACRIKDTEIVMGMFFKKEGGGGGGGCLDNNSVLCSSCSILQNKCLEEWSYYIDLMAWKWLWYHKCISPLIMTLGYSPPWS